MIDFVLLNTGQSDLHYIGHSQGTTSFFVMASLRTDMNAKIRTMHALGKSLRQIFALVARSENGFHFISFSLPLDELILQFSLVTSFQLQLPLCLTWNRHSWGSWVFSSTPLRRWWKCLASMSSFHRTRWWLTAASWCAWMSRLSKRCAPMPCF